VSDAEAEFWELLATERTRELVAEQRRADRLRRIVAWLVFTLAAATISATYQLWSAGSRLAELRAACAERAP
jgi:hypothetical protein